MAEFLQSGVVAETICTAIEQRIKANSQFTGEVPSLAGAAFGPFCDTASNIVRYKQLTDQTKVAGDKGGLFTWTAASPVVLDYLLADFGNATTFTFSVVTRTGDIIKFLTGSAPTRYVHFNEYDRFYLFAGDTVKVTTTGATAAMMVRIGVTLAHGTH